MSLRNQCHGKTPRDIFGYAAAVQYACSLHEVPALAAHLSYIGRPVLIRGKLGSAFTSECITADRQRTGESRRTIQLGHDDQVVFTVATHLHIAGISRTVLSYYSLIRACSSSCQSIALTQRRFCTCVTLLFGMKASG